MTPDALSASGIGSMPGDDYAAAVRTVLDTVPLPYVAELPSRGVHAQMVGRTLAVVDALGVDLQPAGWRITDGSGLDHRRARSLLAQDLDVVEELAGDDLRGRKLKVQVAGPWTLAATVERPRGDKVLADAGLRRDLAQALAEGVRGHVADVARRTGAEVVLQVDEPLLPDVRAARVPTASGFGKHRAVSAAEAAEALSWVVEVAEGSRVLHCCAADVPYDVLREVPLEALAVDLTYVDAGALDALGAWVDAGRQVWAGVVPSNDPPQGQVSHQAMLERLHRFWDTVGSGPAGAVTPTCGLASATPVWAGRALEWCTRLAGHP